MLPFLHVFVPLSVDDCRRVQDPVITPDGHLFSREAILEYFVGQKKEKKRQLSVWEADEKRRELLVRPVAVSSPCEHAYACS